MHLNSTCTFDQDSVHSMHRHSERIISMSCGIQALLATLMRFTITIIIPESLKH